MNVKKFLLASLAVFVTLQILDYVIHMLLLAKDYQATASVWRADMMDIFWIMYITGAILSLLFVYIFIKGYQGKGIPEGIRYGLIMGILLMTLGAVNQYIVYPIPLELAIKWTVYGIIEFMIAGVVAALIYKPKE